MDGVKRCLAQRHQSYQILLLLKLHPPSVYNRDCQIFVSRTKYYNKIVDGYSLNDIVIKIDCKGEIKNFRDAESTKKFHSEVDV